MLALLEEAYESARLASMQTMLWSEPRLAKIGRAQPAAEDRSAHLFPI